MSTIKKFKTPKGVLRAVARLFTKDKDLWIKGSFHDERFFNGGIKQCYCLTGAISSLAYSAAVKEAAIELVYNQLPLTLRRGDGLWDVTTYNDRKSRTVNDIIALAQKAAA